MIASRSRAAAIGRHDGLKRRAVKRLAREQSRNQGPLPDRAGTRCGILAIKVVVENRLQAGAQTPADYGLAVIRGDRRIDGRGGLEQEAMPAF